MTASRNRFYRGLFLVAAIYDLALGFVFVFFNRWAFELLGIEDKLPEDAYIPLIGAFLFVIGVAYVLIFLGDLWRNFDLIVVGTLYKIAYASIALWAFLVDKTPHWSLAAIFGIADAIFFILMIECLVYLRRHPREPAITEVPGRHLVST